MPIEQIEKLIPPGGVIIKGENECSTGLVSIGNRPLLFPQEITEDRFPVLTQGIEVGERARDIVRHRLRVRLDFTGGLFDLRAVERGLLVEQTDRAPQGGVGVCITGIPFFVPVAGVIAPATLIESPGLIRPEFPAPVEHRLGKMVVDGITRRIHEKRIGAAHFVGVDQKMRIPVIDGVSPTPRFGLRLNQPVAVHVKEIMIAASGRPEPRMVHGLHVGIGDFALESVNLRKESLASIGILRGIDMNHQLITQPFRGGILPRGQKISDLHGGIDA